MISGEGTGIPAPMGDPWSDDEPKTSEPKPAADPESAAAIEAEIEAVRRQMSDVAGELHRRRDRVVEFSRRWGWRLAPLAGGLVLVAAAGLGYRYWRARQRSARPARWLRSLQSMQPRAAFDDLRIRASKAMAPREANRPHRLRDVGLRVGTAALGAAASVAGKQLVRKLMASGSSPRP